MGHLPYPRISNPALNNSRAGRRNQDLLFSQDPQLWPWLSKILLSCSLNPGNLGILEHFLGSESQINGWVGILLLEVFGNALEFGMWDVGFGKWENLGFGRWENVGDGMWDVGFRMQDVGFGMWENVGFGRWDVGFRRCDNVKFGMRGLGFRMWDVGFGMCENVGFGTSDNVG